MSPDDTQPAVNNKFPHTRALLSALAREYGGGLGKPATADSQSDSDPDSDSGVRSDALVATVIQLLDDEEEDQIKDLLRETYDINDDAALESAVLELMHRRKDDLGNVPFLFLTPIKRPSRPASRTSYRSSRPGTPLGPSSPLSLAFRRPSTPLGTPTIALPNLNPNSSPSSSPTFANSMPTPIGGGGNSQPPSPMASPRFLNAKANEFRPTMVRSASSSSILRKTSPSPGPDLWAHNYMPSPTLSSASARGSSNLAIAAPLLPERSAYNNSPGHDHPPRSESPTPILIRQDPSRSPYDEDDDDPFSPFVVKQRSQQQQQQPLGVARPLSDVETAWSTSSNSNSSPPNPYDVPVAPAPVDYYGYPHNLQQYERPGYFYRSNSSSSLVPEDGTLGDDLDLTPFEVLSSIFGASVPPATLEAALVNSGYDLDGAMAWLVDQAQPPQPPHLLSGPMQSQQRTMSGGVMVVPRDAYNQSRISGGRNNNLRYNQQQQQKTAGGSRVCRYFLAGDCRRADCRFSHDIDRALCRFWLRGQCAKGEQCEFLHHLPQNIDVSGLTTAMHRTDFMDDRSRHHEDHSPRNDFPTLSQADSRSPGGRVHPRPLDPSRSRWAAAVKQKPIIPIQRPNHDHLDSVIRPSGPRASPRIRLRPPSLLPKLPTGEAINRMYLAYRSQAIELGAARNATLTKAAESWRRGDGATAKRFSREAQELNSKMRLETADAALRLVRERARLAVEAVRTRDPAWSDDPGDRTARGRVCGGGLGVTLGIARKDVHDGTSPEERTESLLDLHGLHSGEAVDVVEDFLSSLEREHFFGLAYLVVGEEKHTGTQDPGRGSSRARLAAGVREWLLKFGFPWQERDGIICVDPLTHV